MRAREIMSRPVITATAQTPIHEAAALMATRGISSLPVVDESGHVAGIVSEIDLLRGRVSPDPTRWLSRRPNPDDLAGLDPGDRVGDVMTNVVVCLPPDADTAELAETMIENNLRAIPITDGAQVVGIVSRRDLVKTLMRDDRAVMADVEERLDAYADQQQRWKVEVAEGVVDIHGHFTDEHERSVVITLARSVPGVVRVHTHRGWFG